MLRRFRTTFQHRMNASRAGGRQNKLRAWLDFHFRAQSVARKHSGGGVNHLDSETVSLPIRLADRKGGVEGLASKVTPANGVARAGQMEVTLQAGTGNRRRRGRLGNPHRSAQLV